MNALARLKTAASVALATVSIAVLTSPAAMAAGDTIGDLTSAAGTEMTPVKGAMITIGIILVGVAALSFAIYKVISMSKGGK
jgi:hypothetical protein